MKRAIYPLSADPVTLGHLNIINRARRVFDEVIIAIGANESKKPLFSLQDRRDMVESAVHRLCGYHGVRVEIFEGMLVDYAFRKDIKTVIRGARSSADFDYERLLSDVNYYQGLGIDTYVLFTEPHLSHISSSAAKAIVQNSGKNILDYVPLFVKKELEEKLLGQFRIGITGETAAGKNYVSAHFKRSPKANICEIDTDAIGHYILEESQELRDQKLRQDLANIFGYSILKNDGMINVPALSEKIFSNSRNRKTYDETVRETMHSEIRSRLLHAKGLVIINCAILIEAGLMPFVNNNVIVVHADQECRIQRMKNRGYSNYKINKRIDAQLAAKEKIAEANRIINRHGTGKVFTYNNHDSVKKRDDYTVLVRSVKRFLKGVENI